MRIGAVLVLALLALPAKAAPLVALAPPRKVAPPAALHIPLLSQVSRAIEGLTLIGSDKGERLQLKPDYNHGPVASLALHY